MYQNYPLALRFNELWHYSCDLYCQILWWLIKKGIKGCCQSLSTVSFVMWNETHGFSYSVHTVHYMHFICRVLSLSTVSVTFHNLSQKLTDKSLEVDIWYLKTCQVCSNLEITTLVDNSEIFSLELHCKIMELHVHVLVHTLRCLEIEGPLGYGLLEVLSDWWMASQALRNAGFTAYTISLYNHPHLSDFERIHTLYQLFLHKSTCTCIRCWTL